VARRLLCWCWLRRKRLIGLTFVAAFLVLNLLAYVHARSMIHFVRGEQRTPPPEALSGWRKTEVLLTGVSLTRPENRATPIHEGLEFTTHKIPSSDGIMLEAWYVQHRQPAGLVLLFHGYAGCKADLLHEAKAFHGMGFSALLMDFRGSGGSDGDVTTIGYREAEDVASAYEWAKRTAPNEPLILYGHSMGSAAILRFLTLHEDVNPAALVLECPFDTLRHTVANRFEAMGIPAFGLADLLIFWGGVQHGFNGFRHNPVDYAKRVRCPVLLLHGADDVRVTSKQAESISQSLQGEKEFHIFEDVGHQSYIGSCAKEWTQVIEAFLGRTRRSALEK
jgi:uncharacterized protein